MVAELTNIGTLFAFILVCGSVTILRKLEPDRKRPFRCPAVPVVPILGIAFCLVLMYSLPLLTWLRFFFWMGLGLIIYANYGYKRSVLAGKMAGKNTIPVPGIGQQAAVEQIPEEQKNP